MTCSFARQARQHRSGKYSERRKAGGCKRGQFTITLSRCSYLGRDGGLSMAQVYMEVGAVEK